MSEKIKVRVKSREDLEALFKKEEYSGCWDDGYKLGALYINNDMLNLSGEVIDVTERKDKRDYKYDSGRWIWAESWVELLSDSDSKTLDFSHIPSHNLREAYAGTKDGYFCNNISCSGHSCPFRTSEGDCDQQDYTPETVGELYKKELERRGESAYFEPIWAKIGDEDLLEVSQKGDSCDGLYCSNCPFEDEDSNCRKTHLENSRSALYQEELKRRGLNTFKPVWDRLDDESLLKAYKGTKDGASCMGIRCSSEYCPFEDVKGICQLTIIAESYQEKQELYKSEIDRRGIHIKPDSLDFSNVDNEELYSTYVVVKDEEIKCYDFACSECPLDYDGGCKKDEYTYSELEVIYKKELLSRGIDPDKEFEPAWSKVSDAKLKEVYQYSLEGADCVGLHCSTESCPFKNRLSGECEHDTIAPDIEDKQRLYKEEMDRRGLTLEEEVPEGMTPNPQDTVENSKSEETNGSLNKVQSPEPESFTLTRERKLAFS